MQLAILSIAVVLVLVILSRIRIFRIASRDDLRLDRRAALGANHPFHAVSIGSATDSCPASQAVRSLRFLGRRVAEKQLQSAKLV